MCFLSPSFLSLRVVLFFFSSSVLLCFPPESSRRHVVASFVAHPLPSYDRGKLAHCDEAFGTEDELFEHKQRCHFRPVQCPNEGCQEVFGANTAGAHDASCPWKRLQCPQGCPLEVPRRHLKSHMTGPCERRPVVCPYHHMGCSTAVYAGTLSSHCKDVAGEHLALVAKRVGRRGRNHRVTSRDHHVRVT